MPAVLYSSPVTLAALAVLLGLFIGSFLNVVVYRIPRMLEHEEAAWLAEREGKDVAPQPAYNLAVPRSQCPACGHRITALENIPVLSWLVLKARCSACQAPISGRYPAVELLTGLLSGLVVWHFGPTWQSATALLLVWVLIALSFIDFDTQLLPDRLTLPLVWAGLLANLAGIGFTSLSEAVIGAAAGYLALWSVYWIFKLATGKEGMGYGDFKLLAALGAWLGWKMLPTVILLSSVAGAVIGIALIMAARRGKDIPIPFGPYLAIAGVVALLYGERLVQGYLDLFP